MKLADLEASFLKRTSDDAWQTGVPFAEADGVMFLCPVCFKANGGPVGTHSMICWFVGKVPDSTDPRPGRWIPSGAGLADLTFIGPAAASVLLTGGCGAHFFVRNGEIRDC